MLDSLFGLASIIGGVAVLLTTKVNNIFKPSTKIAGYLIAFGVSTVLVLVSKFAGSGLGLPDISDLSWLNIGILDILVFAMAGGFWDLLKIVGVRKPK